MQKRERKQEKLRSGCQKVLNEIKWNDTLCLKCIQISDSITLRMLTRAILILALFAFYSYSIHLQESPLSHSHHLSSPQAESLNSHHRSHSPVKHKLNWGHYNSDSSPPSNQLNLNWQSRFPYDRLVSMMSIPGTHDSATDSCKWYQFCDSSQCQSWSLYNQMRAGIRFFDLRVNTQSDAMTIGHGSITFGLLQNELRQIKQFLSEQPSEFIIAAFQRNNHKFPDRWSTVLQLFRKLNLNYAITNRIPTYGQLRGKVWILGGYGFNFQNNGDNFALYGAEGEVTDRFTILQNMYNVFTWSIGEKVRKVKSNALTQCVNNKLKVNFLSGSGGVLPYWLAKTDGSPNEAMDSWLKSTNYKGCLGVTVMDYPGARLIRQIISSNF